VRREERGGKGLGTGECGRKGGERREGGKRKE
jgi:hypothetical protein